MKVGLLALVAVGLVLAAACSTPTALDPTEEARLLTGDLTYMLDDARTREASEAQLEMLEAALTAGELTYDQVAVAHEPFYACVEDAGVPVTVRGAIKESHTGLLVPDYIQPIPDGMSTEQVAKVSDKCYDEHVNFLMGYYVSQPQVVDYYLQTFEEQREYIVDCLTKRGFPVDPDSTRLELLYAVSEENERGNSGRACYQGDTFMAFLPD